MVRIRNIEVGKGYPLVLIAGPCVIESEELALRTAEALVRVADELNMPFIFKSSYDKANRTSIESFRGPGLHEGLKVLAKVRERFGCPVLSDIHCKSEVRESGEVLDCLQIPAFLCRQTDLLVEAGKTSKPINLKKGQFVAPEDMEFAVQKIYSTGNRDVLLTERGTCFGYRNLIVDMRALVVMRKLAPVVFDATHSVQLPGADRGKSGGQRKFVEPLLRSAVAVGVDAIFLEVHPDPDSALSDGPNMLPLSRLAPILKKAQEIHALCP